MNGVLAWTCLPRDSRVRMVMPDGTRSLVVPGTHFVYAVPEAMRAERLHCWLRLIDALFHARGLIACRAHVAGRLLHGRSDGAIWGTAFTALWVTDASKIILRYVIDLAFQVLEATPTGVVADVALVREALTAQRQRLEGQIDTEEYTLLYYADAWKQVTLGGGWWGAQSIIRTALWVNLDPTHRLLQRDLVWTLRTAMEVGERQIPGLGLTALEINGELERPLSMEAGIAMPVSTEE